MNRTLYPRYLRISLLLSAISVGTFLLALPENSLAQGKPRIISIENARKQSLGTAVTVEGTITVPSGAFRSSFDDEGFQVQDKTGGMYVTIKTDLHLTVGQRVRLVAKVSETALKFQILETDEKGVQILSGTSHPKPVAVATGKIGEPILGQFIKIAGNVTKPVVEVAPFGFRVSVDDGTGETIGYVSTSTGISPKAFAVGQRVELIGIAGRFKDHSQIYPRSPADVKLVGKN